jgi:hypothetical protein
MLNVRFIYFNLATARRELNALNEKNKKRSVILNEFSSDKLSKSSFKNVLQILKNFK